MIKNAKELKEFRKDNNISQRELARILKISRNTIAKWEYNNKISENGLSIINRKLFPISCACICYCDEEENKKGLLKRIMGWFSFLHK